jgi:very-short-patch-repair endonuclease
MRRVGVAQFWADLPLDRPISIEGVHPESFALSIESLPAGAPAIVTYDAPPQLRAREVVATLLAELDRVARELYPAWLTEAAEIESAAGAGAVAVRSIAVRVAQARGQYGPFLAELAERSLRRDSAYAGSFGPEIRATGLAKVIADAFGRSRTAILIRVRKEFSEDQQQALIAAGRWLSDSGRFGIWLAGAALPASGVETVRFTMPIDSPMLTADEAADHEPSPDGVVSYPAVAGRPHPGSRAEQLLEASLESLTWAAQREWNQSYRPHLLTNPIRVDLLWRAERVVVEIDGEEHCQPARFAADRQRDVLLQLDRYAVLRFTNRQVLTHRDLVLAQIQQCLAGRRAGTYKGVTHGGPEALPAGTGAPADPDGGER